MTLTLHVTETVEHRPHTWVEHVNCTRSPCALCEGGLVICKVCGGAEGELLDSCPGVPLTPAQHAWNYGSLIRRAKAQMHAHS